MNWLNTKYMIRAGVLTMLLLFPSLLSATCKPDTIIRNYKPDSLKLAIKADSIIAFHEGDSAFTIVKADTVLPYIAEPVLRTGYDRRVHRFRKNWERIIPTHSKIQYAGNMGLLSFGTGWDYGKRNEWETDLLLGFIPKYSSKKDHDTETELYALEHQPGERILYRAAFLRTISEYRIRQSVLGQRTGTLSERILWFFKQGAYPCFHGTTADL